jgi:hypothetical protein
MALTAADFGVTLSNTTQPQIDQLNLALAYLANSPTAAAMLQDMIDDHVTINIIQTNGVAQDQYHSLNKDGSGNYIDWDPDTAIAVTSDDVGAVGVARWNGRAG